MPTSLVCDLHPDYLSSQEAERLALRTGLPLIRVQHHHAHAVACMLEYGLHEPVIAIVLDGTGLGDDGKYGEASSFFVTVSRIIVCHISNIFRCLVVIKLLSNPGEWR